MKYSKNLLKWKPVLVSIFMMFCCLGTALAQNVHIKGVVKDNLGEPMIGVSVLEKGTTNGTVTDFDGNFELQANKSSVLQLSYVGYKTLELKAEVLDSYLKKNKNPQTIVMEEDSEMLEDVVVIGYGTTKAKNFTGSVDVIKMEDSPVASLGLTDATDLLRGNTTGLNISAESGTVGQDASILIRGQKSIASADAEPLLIVNGVIFTGKLTDIDSNSIESMSVLKDATSLAAYGSKAAQGVIMITTKKGKEGKPQISFSTSHAFSTPTYETKYQDPEGYIRYRNAKAGYEDLTNTSWMSFIEQKNYKEGKVTDWYDLATRTGYNQTYNLSFSGSSDKSNYYIGVGHTNQKGMVVGNEIARTNASINVTTRVADWMQVGGNMNWSYTTDDGTPAWLQACNNSPFGEAYLPDGRWRKFLEGGDMTATNPVWDTYNGIEKDNRRTNLALGGFVSIDIPWIEGLNFKMTGSYTTITDDNKKFVHETNFPAMLSMDWEGTGYSSQYYDLGSANGSITNNRDISWVIDNILSYSHSFGDHYVSGSLVYTRDSREFVNSSYSGTNFVNAGNTILGWHGLGNAASKTFDSPTYSLHTDIGYLARIIYSYKDTYHFNASLRRDGSSVFGNKNKWGNFPAVGAAWIVTNEDFMKDLKWLNVLKVKASWGKNGSQTISPYGTLSKLSVAADGGIASFIGGNTSWGQSISTLGNPYLGWQTTTSWNAGFEASVLNNRLTFELNAYKSQTTDQIFDRTIPIMTAGISTQKATMGQVDNWGVEVNVKSQNIKKKDFEWNTNFNFTLNRNKLVDLYGDGLDDITNSLFIGKSLGAIYGYEVGGIYTEGPKGGTPFYIAKDGSVTDNPTADDRKILGYNKENFRMSLGNTLSYKNWQLYFLFNGIFGGGGYGLADNTFGYLSFSLQNRSSCINIPFWTKDNPNTDCPSPSFNNPGDFYKVYNSYGHVRLQDLSLSYNATPFFKKFGFKNTRLTLSGRNLWYFSSSWKRSDPEAQGYNVVQLPKTVTMTLNITY